MRSIEEEVFQRCRLDIEKLGPYGFIMENDHYYYSEMILNDSFRVDFFLTKEEKIKGKIVELAFDEEYTNFRIESEGGGFAAQVREEFQRILRDIKTCCTTAEYFCSNQANRIADLIMETYADKPEFLWEKFPGYGVYRKTVNDKWYALIMNINIGKIAEGDYDVEIINVKLGEDKIAKLLKLEGFYPAYHMNKKNWISIILDETIRDEEIMTYIEESRGRA